MLACLLNDGDPKLHSSIEPRENGGVVDLVSKMARCMVKLPMDPS